MSNGNSWIPPEEFKVKMSIMVGNYELPFQTSRWEIPSFLIWDISDTCAFMLNFPACSLTFQNLFRKVCNLFEVLLMNFPIPIHLSAAVFQHANLCPVSRRRLVGLVRNRPGLKFGRRNLRHFHHLNNRPKSRSAARHRCLKPPPAAAKKSYLTLSKICLRSWCWQQTAISIPDCTVLTCSCRDFYGLSAPLW